MTTFKHLLRSTTLACLVLSLLCASASAAAAGPGWKVTSIAEPTNFTAEHNGHPVPDSYNVVVENVGSQPTNGSTITITDKLPPGLRAVATEGDEFEHGEEAIAYRGPEMSCSIVAGGTAVTCTYSEVVQPGAALDLFVQVSLEPSAAPQEVNVATVTGGGVPSASASEITSVDSTSAPFGVQSFGFQTTGLDGTTDTQAGDRPYESITSYYLNSVFRTPEEGALEAPGEYFTPEHPKDFVFDLPHGFVGDPQIVNKCPLWRVAEANCPPSTQIGVAHLYINGAGVGGQRVSFFRTVNRPIYNVAPEGKNPGQFGFNVLQILLNLGVAVSEETGYGVRVIVAGIPYAGAITGSSVTFFGSPIDDPNIYDHSVGARPLAFMTNPTDCSTTPLTATMSTDSWQHPGSWRASGEPDLSDSNWKQLTSISYPSLEGCDMLQFNPSISVTPDSTQADEPTGVTVDVHVPQSTNEFPALQTPELKDASVTLPAGLSLSPSAADGLESCSDQQLAEQSTEPAQCPDGSVLGTVKIATPLLEGPLEGHIFLGTPECDPCSAADAADGRELRIFLQAAGFGVRIKREGRVYVNPSTGQLTTKFVDNPQLPFEDLQLHFSGGPRAGLATPQACGVATTTADFTPWSAPVTPDATPFSSFGVDWNGAGGACPASLPFNPSFSAGTSNPNAGQFSPLTLTFGRQDREQDLSQIQVRMPAGLLGTLSSVPLCGEPQASLGSCPAGSRLGSMTVAAGAGPHPFYESGSLYLTGPYGGAPFGLSIVVPTVAGPFNLGNVVVRAKINVDPVTSALTVTSDAFPQIIDGIPLRLRTANVTIDRPGFIFNPTNCAQQQITARIVGAQGATADVTAPFAVSGCAGLHFGPKFSVSTSGHTSRANGASLDAKVTFPAGAQSNIARVKVDLPKQLPSRLTTLQKACPSATFQANPASCPAASVIGIVKAITPVLPVALKGPVYFVSHGGEAFPALVAVLQGYGVRVDLTAATFISPQGVTSSTFKSIPDVPVSSFELYLPEGKSSALAANGNLCASKLQMPTSFVAQDGAQLRQSTKVTVTGCGKPKQTTKAKQRAKQATKSNSAGNAHGEGRKA